MISQELQLDASSAEAVIADIGSALEAAAGLFKAGIDDGIAVLSQPIDVAPIDVPVVAETSGAVADIAALADTTTVDVPVTADTGGARTDIEALQNDVPALDVVVEVDTANATAEIANLGTAGTDATGNIEQLETSLTGLGAAAGIAEGSSKELLSVLGDMGGEAGVAAGAAATLGAVVAGFYGEGLKAVSAGQRFATVLGDMATEAKEINVNGLNTSIEDLGVSFGSTSAEMENSTATLFTFASSAGASKEKAVEFTHQVETLAARAISLNPALGTLSEVTDAMGPKLARGGRFAATFGLSLTAAEITSRALRDTGKTLSSELSVQEKAMAGAEIASERYGKGLAGDVANGQKNAAVQAEALSASFKEAIEQIGAPLVAPVLDLIKSAIPDAVMVAETLGHLAIDVLPVVSAALDILSLPLKVVDFVLGEIPGPVITAAAAFLGLGLAVQGLAIAVPSLAVAIDAAFPEIAILSGIAAAAFGLWQAISGGGPFVDDVTTSIDSAVGSLGNFEKSATAAATAAVEAAAKDDNFSKALNKAGVTTDELTKSLIAGGHAFSDYKDQIVAGAIAAGEGFDATIHLAEELDHLKKSTEAAAKAALDSAVATGQITQAEEDAAIAKAGQIDGETNYAAALDTVQPKIKAASDAADAQAKANEDAADAAKKVADAYDALSTAAPGVAASLDAIGTGGGTTGTNLLDLAVSMDHANLSADQLAAVAQHLGVNVDALKGFVKTATGALDDFVSAALKGLPTVTTAIDKMFDAQSKQAQLNDKLAAADQRIADAQANLGDAQAKAGDAADKSARDTVDATNKVTESQAKLDALRSSSSATADQIAAATDGVTSAESHLADVRSNAGSSADTVVQAEKDIAQATADRQKILDDSATKPIIIDPFALQKELGDAIQQITDFNANIKALHDAGFDNLAAVAAQRGPEFTAGLVNAINSGDGIGAALNQRFGELNAVTQAEGPLLKAAGAGIITATGEIGTDATNAFGTNFAAVPVATAGQLESARLLAKDSGIPFSKALEEVAGVGVAAYAKALDPMAPATTSALDASGRLVHGSDLPAVAAATGTATADGFGAGFGDINDQTHKIIDDVSPTISNAAATLRPIADTEGFFVGYAFTTGLRDGIGDPVLLAGIDAAARDAVDHAVNAAKLRAGINSPSTVMIGVGRNMGEGLAIGIADTHAQVAAAATRLASVASVAVHADVTRTVNLRRPAGIPGVTADAPTAAAAAAAAATPGVLLQVDARGSNPHEVAELTASKVGWTLSTRGDF